MQITGPNLLIVVTRLRDVPPYKPERKAFYRVKADFILAEKFGITETVVRNGNGAPSLSGKSLSISHSNEFLAIMVAGVSCGIDIQVQDRFLEPGKDWFYNSTERELFGENPPEDLLYRIWCAKEAFYKMQKGEIGDLRSEVTALASNTGSMVLEYRKQQYEVQIRKGDEFFLAYCFVPDSL